MKKSCYGYLAPVLLSVLIGTLLAACTPLLPRHPVSGSGAVTYKSAVEIRYRGSQRTYRVHLPSGYDARRPLPMVVVLHGAFGSAEGMERYSGFSDLGDEKHFIALYPNGIGALGFLQHWNAGHCCGKAAADRIDDVGFLIKVIADACTRLAVDRRRIYMVGFSNGAMMTYRFAAERGDLLAGIAVLAGSAGGRPDSQSPEWRIPEPEKPLPVMVIHGLADAQVPFDGRIASAENSVREYWSVMQSLDVWLARNGCRPAPVIEDRRQGRVQVRAWPDCRDENQVVLYMLKGWEHIWPGLYFTADLDSGNPMHNFDAARIIWSFFEKAYAPGTGDALNH